MFDLNAEMERIFRIGPSEAMRQDERAIGFEPVAPGAVPWLSAEDWSPGDVVSVKGKHVRIVAIKAQQPGTGAFSRLITAIAKAGLRPIVVEPLFDMPDILRRWGWSHRDIGRDRERQEIWEPSLSWLKQRATV